MDKKQLKQALVDLEDDRKFRLVMEWFEDERNHIIELLAEQQSSESLQGLSGQLRTMTFIINAIKKQQER